MNSRAPGTTDSARRILVITASIPSRCASGFRATKTWPVLVCPPLPPLPWPVKPTTLCTAGSCCTISISCVSFCCIAWNEML